METIKQVTSLHHRILIGIMAMLIGIAPFICCSAKMYDFSNLPQSAYLQNVSVLFLVIFFLNGFFKKQLVIKWSALYIPIFGLLAWSFLSLFWATNASEGLAIWLNWLAGGFIFFVVYNLISDAKDIQIFFVILIFSAVFIVFVGINQFLETGMFSDYPQIVAPAATFGNKNMMIDVLITLMPISLFLITQNSYRNIFVKIIGGSIFGACMVLVVLSDTRAGLLALAIQVIAIIVIFFIRKGQVNESPSRKTLAYVSFVSLVFSASLFFLVANQKNKDVEKNGAGLVVSSSNILNRIETIFKTNDEDKWALKKGVQDEALKPISDSRTMRLVTWQNTLVMFLDKPLIGFGLFNWQIHYGEYRTAYLNDPVYRPGMNMVEVHNDYLQLLVDLGIPGVLFALLLLYFNGQTLLIVKKVGQAEDFFIAIILGIALSGLHLVALFSFPFERSVPVILFFLYCAFLAFFRDKYLGTKPNRFVKVSGKWCVLVAVFWSTVFLGLLYVQNRRFDAEAEFKAAYDQHAVGNYALGAKHAKQALEANPYRYLSYFLLGYCQLSVQKNKEAEEALLKGLKYYPNDLNSLLQLGTVYTKQTMSAFAKNGIENQEVIDLIEKSNTWFDKALKIRKDFHIVYFNKGVVYWQRSEYAKRNNSLALAEEYHKKAIENYKKSLEYNPFYVDAMNALAQLLYAENQKKEAIAYAEKAVNLLVSDFEKTDKHIIELSNAKVDRASNLFGEAVKKRQKARQLFIVSVMKSLQILKIYYGSIEVNFEKYLEVVQVEERYFLAKEVEIQEQYMYSEAVLQSNAYRKETEPDIYLSMEKEYKARLNDVNSFKLDKQMAIVILYLNKGEVYQNMKNYDLALKSLLSVVKYSESIPINAPPQIVQSLSNYSNNAHIYIADILCLQSTINNEGKVLNAQKFLELSPAIEAHLKLVKLKEGDKLNERYNATAVKFLKFKEIMAKQK